MKIFKQHALKFVVILMALFCVKTVSAQNTISIDPIQISGYEVVNVPVLLNNTDAVAAFQFDVNLPDALEFAGDPIRNSDRLLNSHQLTFSP